MSGRKSVKEGFSTPAELYRRVARVARCDEKRRGEISRTLPKSVEMVVDHLLFRVKPILRLYGLTRPRTAESKQIVYSDSLVVVFLELYERFRGPLPTLDKDGNWTRRQRHSGIQVEDQELLDILEEFYGRLVSEP